MVRDFQAKRDLLINLKRKILEKNPDEFYFNMTKTQIKVQSTSQAYKALKLSYFLNSNGLFQFNKDGVHKLRNPFVDFTEDEIKLMKSQDKNYIKFHQQMELKVNKTVFNFFSK